jgi:hypothetical protein
VVPDSFQDNQIEPVGVDGAGVVRGLVSFQQRVGHRQRPDLAVGAASDTARKSAQYSRSYGQVPTSVL